MTVFRSSNGTTAAQSGSSGVSANTALGGYGDVIKVVNNSVVDAYVKTGVGAQTATTSDLIVPTKTEAFFQIDFADDNVAVKTPNSSVNIYILRGSAR